VLSGGGLRRADHTSRGVIPIVLCLSVIVKFDNEEVLAHQGLLRREKQELYSLIL